MAALEPIMSKSFPKGSGDFAIISSDNFICYFPSQILTRVSSWFRDMLSVPTPDGQEKVVSITESGYILEVFLNHIDPNNITHSIDEENIVDLIIMADKHNVQRIIQWFQLEATATHSNPLTPWNVGPFTEQNPVLVLALAVRLQSYFKMLGTEAMRILAGRDLRLVLDAPSTFDPLISREIWRLRQDRLNWYEEKIPLLVASLTQKTCIKCSAEKGKWLFALSWEISRAPNWQKFTELHKQAKEADSLGCKNYDCGTYSRTWKSIISQWEQLPLEEEGKRPNWPL